MLLVAANTADDHDPGARHPESRSRTDAAVAGIADVRLDGEIVDVLPRAAWRHELAAVHDIGYLDALADLCATGGGSIDPDTRVSPGSWETARLTAGAGLGAIESLQAGGGDAAFVIGRPPGHHATRDQAMGFCLINNVAVAAAALAEAGERVAVVDWDVHHGNGTQAIFWRDPRVLYISIHQWPLYPGTGRPEERGSGPGYGTTINLPMPPRTSGDTYRALFDEVIAPSVERFGASWVLVSAGFDAHREDPLGEMRLTAGDYADLTRRVAGISRPGRLVLFLEGGYSLAAVRASVSACAAQLADSSLRTEPLSRSEGTGRDRVDTYRRLFVDEAAPE